MYVACSKAVEDCRSVIGVKWSQLETFVVLLLLVVVVAISTDRSGM